MKDQRNTDILIGIALGLIIGAIIITFSTAKKTIISTKEIKPKLEITIENGKADTLWIYQKLN